jgi:hydroxypyruvate isomerase
MNRRNLLRAAAFAPAAGSLIPASAAPYSYHLRYAPRMGFLNEPIPDQLQAYADAGFKAFEYNGLPKHTDAEIASFRKKTDSLGLSMGVFVVNSGGWKNSATVDKQYHPQFFADVKRAVEIHNIIGNECATVTTGVSVPQLTFTEQTNNCVEAFKRAAEMVEKTKMVLVLEPLNIRVDHAGYFVVFSAHGAEIVDRVNHPNFRMLFDMYHQQISEGNLINHINKYYDRIGYFQVGDVPGRREPGTGEVNWPNVFKAIHGKGYKGILGMEHGLSGGVGPAGMQKCFDAYRKADQWS